VCGGVTICRWRIWDFHLKSPIIASGRIIIMWGNCATQNPPPLPPAPQYTE